MKKSFLTLLFIVLSTTVFSQITIEPGVRAGVNFSRFSSSEFDAKTDFYIGGFAEINFANFFALRPELSYSRQGASPNLPGISDIEIQYLSFALVNKFSPLKKAGVGLYFTGGPAVSLRVGDNLDDFGGTFSSLRDFDILIFGGIGYELPFNLSIEARYNIGFVDIIDTEFSTSFFSSDVNEVIQIGATYKFDF